MARKKPTSKVPPVEIQQGEFYCKSDAAWGGFINIKLSELQKGEFKLWYETTPDEAGLVLSEFLNQGGKLSVTFDREHDSYIVTYTGALMGNSADRFAVSSRSSDLSEALAIMAWKHGYLAEGDYGNWRPFGNTMEHWG